MPAQQPISAPPDFSSMSYAAPDGKKFVVPLALSIAALVLSLCGHAASALGIACAVAALVVRAKSHTPVHEHRAPRATIALSACAIVFGALVLFAGQQTGSISVNVDVPDWDANRGTVEVVVDGIASDGTNVHETLEVSPGTPVKLSGKKPGTYSFSVNTDALETDDRAYEAGTGTGPYELSAGQEITADIRIDAVALTGTLSVAITAPDWKAEYGAVSVTMKGASKTGQTVSRQIDVTPGTETAIDGCKAGTYTFTVDEAVLTQGTNVFKVENDQVQYTFDKHGNAVASIELSIDEQATAEAQKKAEEEAQRQKEEELAAQQQAEEEAAAQAQKEQEAQTAQEAQAAAAAAQADTSGATVYVTKSGEKYHRDGCSSLRKSKIPMSLSEAKSKGYEPCSKCNPGA